MRKPTKPTKSSKPSLMDGPVFVYVSTCCNEQAAKPPCVKGGRKGTLTNSLGTWRCSKCNRCCKVNRSKNKVDKQPEQA